MKMKLAIRFSTLGILAASVLPALAENGEQPLYLRLESGTCLYKATTCYTVQASPGNSPATLPFTGTTTYNFYSAPLSASMNLTTADKASGTVFVQHTAPNSSNNYQVTCRFQYSDYDPATGTETVIVTTAESGPQNMHPGPTQHWSPPDIKLPANVTVSAGHLVHVAMRLTLVSGNPGAYAQVVYNGTAGQTSIGLLANDTSAAWSFGGLVCTPPNVVSFQMLGNKTSQVGCLGMPNQCYLIQATCDLASGVWTTIGTNTSAVDGCYSYIDSDATNYPCRFYRTVAP